MYIYIIQYVYIYISIIYNHLERRVSAAYLPLIYIIMYGDDSVYIIKYFVKTTEDAKLAHTTYVFICTYVYHWLGIRFS